ncbi:polygalacturonase [Sphingomonas insulae]|uniref:Glycosyl hydrolase family 28 protein n=1 Tax=Sphingomonas insulae TaxID=424800 RepID=A0ABP3SYD4_9SPHN|nr:glycosyl hydrolase family 28 protein [Sphingomonas insulae]NIJ30916.1 polygalacturonase [Sphingomonas insulae]
MPRPEFTRRTLVAAGLALPLLPARLLAAARVIDPADHGAVGDGDAIETRAIQAAIDAAARAGGGTVRLRPGVYRSGALFVASGVTLDVARGATLRGVGDIAAYPMMPTRVAGIEMPWPAALVNLYRVRDARVTGEGIIDGDGKVFWDSYWRMRRAYDPRGLRWAADYDCRRPRLIQVFDCDRVRVDGLMLTRSGFWTVHVCYSRDVTVADLTIRNNIGGRGPSTDGVDIDSSERVRVERCDISVNDDALCIKAGRDWDGLRVARPCRDVTIRDCVVRDALAGMTFGSETSGGFRNIDIAGLTIMHPVPIGIFFKSGSTRGGTIRDIRIADVVMQDVATLFQVNLNWYPNYSYAKIPAGLATVPPHYRALATPVPRDKGLPHISGVSIDNVRAVGGKIAFQAAAYPDAPLDSFTFRKLRLDVREGGEIADARNWRFEDCTIDTLDGTPPALLRSTGVTGL